MKTIKRFWIAACMGMTILVCATTAVAIDYTWTNSAGGDFGTAGNWNPAGPPGSGNRAVFSAGNSTRAIITFPAGTTSSGGLRISKASTDNQYEFAIANGGVPATYVAGATVLTDTGSHRADLLVSDGTLESTTVNLSGYDSIANIILDGPDTLWRITQNFNATQTTLDLEVRNGAKLDAQGGSGTAHNLWTENLDANRSDRRIRVTGSGSSMTFTNLPTAAYFKGTTWFEILDGATATFDNVTFKQSDTVYSNIYIVVSNATLNTASLGFTLGYSHFRVLDGATVTCLTDFNLDDWESKHARATIDNSTLTFGGNLTCGKAGQSTLVITNGGRVVGTNNTPYFPRNSTPTITNRIIVTGVGSLLKTKSMTPGGTSNDQNSPFYLDVVDGGLFEQVGGVDARFTVWTKGVITLDSGTISNATTLGVFGRLEGNGEIVGAVQTGSWPGGGTVRPGGTNSAGRLSIGGTFAQMYYSSYADGRLELEIGGTTPGTGYDVLDVTKAVTLAEGPVTISVLPGFKPPIGATTYDMVTGSSVSTNGATITLPPDSETTTWSIALTDIDGGRKALRVTSFYQHPATFICIR